MAKKPPLRRYKIRLDAWGATLRMCVGPRDSFARFLANRFPGIPLEEFTPPHDGKFFAVEDEGFTEYYVWVEEFDWTIRSQGLLVHELLHAVIQIHRDAGLTLTPESEEAYTYTLQYLMCEAWSKLAALSPHGGNK